MIRLSSIHQIREQLKENPLRYVGLFTYIISYVLFTSDFSSKYLHEFLYSWKLIIVLLLLALGHVAARISSEKLDAAYFGLSLSFLVWIPFLREQIPVLLPTLIYIIPSGCFGIILGSLAKKYVSLPTKQYGKWLFIAGWLLYILIGMHYLHARGFHAGDEKYYYIQAESIIQDFDTDLKNNKEGYVVGEAFYKINHLAMNSRQGYAYSWHPIGLPLLISPALFLANEYGVKILLALFGALMLTQLYRLLRVLNIERNIAWGTVWFFGLTSPLVIYSMRCYTEVLAAFIVLFVINGMLDPRCKKVLMGIFLGFLVGYLYWLQTRRYFPLMGLYFFFLFISLVYKTKPLKFIIPSAVTCLIVIGVYLVFNVYRFSNPDPLLIEPTVEDELVPVLSGGLEFREKLLTFSLNHMFAVFFDHFFGFFLANPTLAMFFPLALFCPILFVSLKDVRSLFLFLLPTLSIYLLCSASLAAPWHAGSASHPPRYLVVIVPLLAIPFAKYVDYQLKTFGTLSFPFLFAVSISVITSLFLIFVAPYVRFEHVLFAYENTWKNATDIDKLLPKFYNSYLPTHQEKWPTIVRTSFWMLVSMVIFYPRYKGVNGKAFILLLVGLFGLLSQYGS